MLFFYHKTAEELKLGLISYFEGKGYPRAIEAMNFASTFHTGYRDDNKNPEFIHQLEIVRFLTIFDNMVPYPQELYMIGFLHDVVEDYSPTIKEIRDMFGSRVSHTVNSLTNLDENKKRIPMKIYYKNMSYDPIAIIVKGVDRMHNIFGMVDVFSLEKQERYLLATKKNVIPMLEKAIKDYPQYECIYSILKHNLNMQVGYIGKMHNLLKKEEVRDGKQ